MCDICERELAIENENPYCRDQACPNKIGNEDDEVETKE